MRIGMQDFKTDPPEDNSDGGRVFSHALRVLMTCAFEHERYLGWILIFANAIMELPRIQDARPLHFHLIICDGGSSGLQNFILYGTLS